jgi:hypothetical protein
MAISFPASPTLNQTYVFSSITWTYNGTAWTKASAVNSILPAQATNSGKFLTTDGTAASWSTVSVTPTAISDQANTSTGYLDLPIGTTLQRPVSPGEGNFRINSTTGALEVYYLGYWSNIKSLGVSAASGGTIITEGNYKVHTFTTGSNFIVSQAGSPFEILLVAGGGGGGHDVGGGGGAGGLIYQSTLELSATTYPITIGGGGAGSGSLSGTAGNGVNTTGFGLTAIGGGGGANYTGSGSVSNGATGGSGGGGVGYTWPSNGGAGTAGQGFLGGNGVGTTSGTGGGGGGATAAGATGIVSGSGFAAGGTGFTSLISGTSTTYATGGRGGGDNWTGAASAAANTGNGGDGQGIGSSGGSGGSGIVIIRYRYQ